MPIGRPTLLTPEIVASLDRLVPRHPFPASLAAALGVSYASLRRWYVAGYKLLRKVERNGPGVPTELTEADALRLSFCTTLRNVLATYEAKLLARLRETGAGWQSYAWELERRFPTRWGRGRIVEAQLRQFVEQTEREVNQRARRQAKAAGAPPT